MSETNIKGIKIPEGTGVKFTENEGQAVDIALQWNETVRKRQKESLSAKRIAEIMKEQRREKQQRLFAKIDVAMWSVLAVEFGILALVWFH